MVVAADSCGFRRTAAAAASAREAAAASAREATTTSARERGSTAPRGTEESRCRPWRSRFPGERRRRRPRARAMRRPRRRRRRHAREAAACQHARAAAQWARPLSRGSPHRKRRRRCWRRQSSKGCRREAEPSRGKESQEELRGAAPSRATRWREGREGGRRGSDAGGTATVVVGVGVGKKEH
jgi:hypothetical protein